MASITSPKAPPPSPPASDDSIGWGVLQAVAWQLGLAVLSAPMVLHGRGALFPLIWGPIQWLVLVLIHRRRKRKGYPLAAKGIQIAGWVGVLLSAGCAALLS